MFADLVGFTAMSAKLDPEDLRAAVRAYQSACTTAIERFGGTVAQYLGDGILAYFGYPRAHEDDAQRAARAGLAIVEAVSALRARDDSTLAARIGIATGLVVVGDVVGSELIGGQSAIGETPNLAARLQGLAGTGQIIIAPSTRRLLGNQFDLVELDETGLKGIAKPIRPFRVEGETLGDDRFEARRRAASAVFIGRSPQIALLQAAWADAMNAAGSVVLLKGDAGVGKSRLCFELSKRIATTSHAELRLQCSEHHTGSQLHPVARYLERAAGIVATDLNVVRLAKLRRWVAEASLRPGIKPDEVLAVLATVLSVPGTDSLPAAPQARRIAIRTLLSDLILGAAEKSPLLLLVEDAHWIDPTTKELLGAILPRLGDARLLMLVTARSEYQPSWLSTSAHTEIRVERLGTAESSTLVKGMFADEVLGDALVKRIVEKADGVPLFLEETALAAIEARRLGAQEGAVIQVPATLQELLLARLQGLTGLMPFIQAGAAIGREFQPALIARVMEWDEKQVSTAAARASQSGLLHQHGAGPDAPYVFKHALIQDAAYSTMLLARRREVHARIADALQELFPERCAAEPEALARHLGEAGRKAAAIDQWERAADLALTRFAGAEAIQDLETALALVHLESGTAATARRELDLLLKLGPVVMTIRATGSGEPERIYQHAADLSAQVGTPAEQFAVAFHLWYIYDTQARTDLAAGIIEKVRRLAAVSGDSELLVQADHADWTTSLVRGAWARCLRSAEDGMARHPAEDRHFRVDMFAGHDPLLCALGHRAISEWVLGQFGQGLASADRLQVAAAKSDHMPSRIVAQYALAALFVYAQDSAQVQALAEPIHALCKRLGVKRYEGVFGVYSGWARAVGSRDTLAVDAMIDALALIESMGMLSRIPFWKTLIADGCRATGRIEEGLRQVEAGLEAVERHNERGYLPHALITRAELCRDAGRRAEGETHYLHAIQVSQSQRARAFELRATLGLAQMRAAARGGDSVVQLLEPMCAGFADDTKSVDLVAARDLLQRHRA